MTTPDSNPWVGRRRLGARLRRLRLAAGRSIEEAAAELIVSVAKISRMETSGRGCSERDVRDLCRFYGAPDPVRTELMHAAALTKIRGWWHEFGPLEEAVEIFVDFESVATAIRIYDTSLLPGLLQTPEFTRAMLPWLRPEGVLSEEWIERTVRLRTARQERIRTAGVDLHVLVDEAALRRNIGDPAVMARQVRHLISEGCRANIRLQVVPFERGYHAGLERSFQHLTLPADDQDFLVGVVHVEGQFGNFVLDKPVEVQLYASIFDDISTRVALNESDSVAWLERLLGRSC